MPSKVLKRVGKPETGALPTGRLLHIQINVVEEHRDLFQEAAAHAGLTFSAWARSLLLPAARAELAKK